MPLKDYKITAADIIAEGVQGLPGTTLTGTAAENKAVFDNLITEIVKARLNGLIDELVTELAGKMAAPAADGVAGQYLKTDGAGGRSWDTPSGSGDMLRSEYDTDADGVVDAAESAGTCSGNAATADRWKTARTLTLKDADETNAGAAVSVDGSGDIVLKLPAALKANLTGNVAGNVNGNAATASSAAKLATARTIDGVSFDGTANIQTRVQFTDTAVAAAAWAADTTYADFPYRAAVALSGVAESMTPEVVLAPADALSGNFAPVAACYAGGVYLYAAGVPEAALTIPTILCWKAVS